MKTKITIILLLVVLVACWRLSHQAASHLQSLASTTSNAETNLNTNLLSAESNAPNTLRPQMSQIPSSEDRAKKIEHDLLEGKNAWQTPIEFYGQVLDESNNPVSNVQINFDCNDLSPAGTSFYQTRSDAHGLFLIKDIKGKILGVNANKAGYYPYHPYGDSFEYGDSHITSYGKDQPIIVRLRKKGEGVSLIHYNKGFPIPKNGTIVLVDLATGNITSTTENSIKVECWTHDNEKKEGWKFDWQCRISVPNGGLQIFDEAFPFLAPEEGYVSQEIIDMPVAGNANWSQDVQRKFYIKTASGHFARMEFRMVAHGDHFCRIDSFFNSSGSRNLEPK